MHAHAQLESGCEALNEKLPHGRDIDISALRKVMRTVAVDADGDVSHDAFMHVFRVFDGHVASHQNA